MATIPNSFSLHYTIFILNVLSNTPNPTKMDDVFCRHKSLLKSCELMWFFAASVKGYRKLYSYTNFYCFTLWMYHQTISNSA